MKRDNLPKEEDFGIVHDDDDEDKIVNQLEKDLFEEEKVVEETQESENKPQEEVKQEETKVESQDKQDDDDVDDLLDELINDKE